MTQNRQNIKDNQYDYVEELKEELRARAASSLVSLDYTDLGQVLTMICDCEAAIFKFDNNQLLCIGITQEDWKNFEKCKGNKVSCNISGLRQGNCEIAFRLLQKGKINYLCWKPGKTDFSELWLLGLQDFPTNAIGVHSILKRIPEIAGEFNIRKPGEAPIDKAPIEYDLPLSREAILENSIGQITEKLNLRGIAKYLNISPDAIRVGFLLYHPLERILKFTSLFNFRLSPLAKSDKLLESKQSKPLVNVARVLLDKGLKTYLGELENAKQCSDATRIGGAVEILNNRISEIKGIEDIKDILKEIREKTQGICVENEADNDLLKGIEKELPKWFENAMENCDSSRNSENDPHEEFFKYLGREIEQPYHTGIPFYFIDSKSPTVFKNLIKDAKRVDKRIYNNWRTRILQCIEVYLGEGGIHDFVKTSSEIRETGWLILVPLYSRGQKKGIMYIQYPYYIKNGHITTGDGEYCENKLHDFLENKGEFRIYKLFKDAAILANQIGDQIQSVDDEIFLYEISALLSKIRELSIQEFSTLILAKLHYICNPLYARFIYIDQNKPGSNRIYELDEAVKDISYHTGEEVRPWWKRGYERVTSVPSHTPNALCKRLEECIEKKEPIICKRNDCNNCKREEENFNDFGDGDKILNWGICLLLPIKLKQVESNGENTGKLIGAFEIFLEETNNEQLQKHLTDLMDVIGSGYSYYETANRIRSETDIALRNAMQAAIAAIMARNMSHLLGSHVEPGIQNDILSFMEKGMLSKVFKEVVNKDLGKQISEDDLNNIKGELRNSGINKVLLKTTSGTPQGEALSNLIDAKDKALERYSMYRQRRMDFIARIATEWPRWGVGYEFYRHFIFPFMSNSILLHFVGYSDGFTIENIDFSVKVNGKPIKEKYNSTYLQPLDLIPALLSKNGDPKIPFELEKPQPIILWSRGGDMGVQAFHIIFENLIRNSIKHSKKLQAETEKDFKIGVFLFEDKNDLGKKFKCSKDRLIENDKYVYVVVSSNADVPKISEEIDKRLCNPIIKATGEKDPEAWGIKEMKIVAAFLSNEDTDACNDENPNFIQAGTYKWDDGERHLAYCFIIPKFHYVGVLK